ncbi:MAG: hypothetical protein ACPGF7_00995 [Pontibacterium sp.]
MTSDNHNTCPPLKSLLSMIALILLGGFILSGSYLWVASDKQASAETRTLGQTLAKQTSLLIRPLLLADDRISENHLLKELQALDYIAGLQLASPDGTVLARAGLTDGPVIVREIRQQDHQLGTLTLWLDAGPLQHMLHRQLLLTLSLFLLITGLLLLILWQRLRPEKIPAPAFADSLRAASSERAPNKPVRTRHTQNVAVRPIVKQPLPESVPAPADPIKTKNDEPIKDDTFIPDAAPSRATDITPEHLQPLEEPAPSSTGKQHEARQALHATEYPALQLPADDAAYILYIDTTSACAGYTHSSERNLLLNVYNQLARQVVRIYGGQFEALANGDMQILFNQPLASDEHGANAVCSGLLFSLLYKGFNQDRIRQFKPVLNVHIALVRGHKNKIGQLQKEARMLARTTQSNNLISHIPLTDVPDLKRTLLKEADIRRENEDKVLILKVVARYQSLFEKQSEHLLSKLKNADQPKSGA